MEGSESIKLFCEKTGIGFEPDADGSLAFEADGLRVTISELHELDAIALVGDLGEPPPERLEGLYKALLGANYMFGGTMGSTIALNPDDGRITLCRAMPTSALDVDQLCSQLEHFLNTAETWRKIVSDYRESDETAAGGDAAGAAPSSGDFLRV